jgi:hypothetical protein
MQISANDNPLNQAYQQSLTPLFQDIAYRRGSDIPNSIIDLSCTLIDLGIQVDKRLLISRFNTLYDIDVERDVDHPPFYMSHACVGQPWADTPFGPVSKNEKWNAGRRKSYMNNGYLLDKENRPINPFYNFGVMGPGVIGRYGPNHAIDIAPVRMIPGKSGMPSLHVLGIVRMDDRLPSLCGGFVDCMPPLDAVFPYTSEQKTESITHEFLEEMVCGSFRLDDPHAAGLSAEITKAIQERTKQHGDDMDHDSVQRLYRQMVTHRKMIQIYDRDPGFISRLTDHFSRTHTCYNGPVMSSTRNTNSAWMETSVSWVKLDPNIWEDMTTDCTYPYTFQAGDDAADVKWHHIDLDLVRSSGAHGAFFCYILASALTAPEQFTREDQEYLSAQASCDDRKRFVF